MIKKKLITYFVTTNYKTGKAFNNQFNKLDKNNF